VTFARLQVSGDASDEPTVRWHFSIGKRTGASVTSSEFSSALPSSAALPEGPSAYLHEPPAWMSDPALARTVSFSLMGTPGATSERPTLGQALVEVAKTTRMDAVADAFHSTRITGIKVDRKPLGDALTGLARMTGHRWWKQDDFVMFRSLTFESDRRREPPATAVGRWIQRCQLNSMEIDDYAEIAALPDAQIATLTRMSIRGEFPDSLQPISQAREHLRLWDSLTQPQRRKARTMGLPYESLSVKQKELYVVAIRDPRTSSSYRGRNWRDSVSITESIAKSTLRLEVRETKMWAVRKGDSISLGGNTTKEEALQQIQQSNPGVKLSELRSVVFATVAFTYQSERGPTVRAWATLPQRWED
jgi:hypothetical protein